MFLHQSGCFLCCVMVADTFYPSTGMSLWQRCVNTAATLSVRAMAYFHGDFGPIRKLADRRVPVVAVGCVRRPCRTGGGSTGLSHHVLCQSAEVSTDGVGARACSRYTPLQIVLGYMLLGQSLPLARKAS